jgi:UDP-N-acetylglucosamine--N-acetylmuramyl-(pentapeptide) pyrophosphoryl-undecaprenol N-acetylglucosamine transferase
VQAEVMPFIEDMAAAYAWADLIVCRAGALTIAEVAAAGVASILIPFPHAVDDHQTANAHYLADNGAAVLVQQRDLDPYKLAQLLQALLADKAQLLQMAQRARHLAKPQATAQVAAICATYAGYDFNNSTGQ